MITKTTILLKNKLPLLGLLLVIALSSCSKRYYVAANFEETTADHKTIAILPYEVVFTGNMPKELTEEDILKIEEGESLAFQTSFYRQLLGSTKGGKKPIYVGVQAVDKTNSMLENSGLSLRETWTKEPDELAKMLGVDAVVRNTVIKTRYISDLASFGIELGEDIIYVLSRGQFGIYAPYNLKKTNDVEISCSLVNADDGNALFSESRFVEVDWRNPPNAVVDHINWKIAKHFPYRD